MKYFEKHFQHEVIFRAPHRWFLALIISPIHFLEMNYKKHYHLQFTHARKLFFFDVSLVALTIILISSTLYWLTYDPTIVRNLDLRITPEIGTRIISGKNLSLQIDYKNLSKEKMLAPEITFQFPRGFYLQKISTDNFVTSTNSFSLSDLPVGGNGVINLSGQFFGSDDTHTSFIVILSYGREGSKKREQKNAQYIAQVIDSAVKLSTDTNFPSEVAVNTATNFKIIVNIDPNLYTEETTPQIQFQPETNKKFTISNLYFTTGQTTTTCSNNLCVIPNDTHTNQLELTGKIFIPKNFSGDKLDFSILPKFVVEKNYFPQKKFVRTIPIIHPEISLQTNFIDQPKFISGGETLRLSGTIRNTGSVNFEHARLSLNTDSEIFDLTKMRELNHAEINNKTFKLDENFNAKLLLIKTNDTIPFEIVLPLRSKLPNTLGKISLKLNFTANVAGSEKSVYEISDNTAEIKIAPNQTLSAEARYFTPEGDQIGRGPLPPTVGKETKYWIIVRFKNSYSDFQNANFTAHLPPNIIWTGRSSVSSDIDLKFDPTTRLITWHSTKITANENVGLNFEVASTPTTAQIGKYFDLLENIRFTGFDPITEKDITKTVPNINSALVSDKEAVTIGTKVR